MLTPERTFLLLGLIFGGLLVFITPAMQVVDENFHFFRAFQISEGSWIAKKKRITLGGELPSSLGKLGTIMMFGITGNPEGRISKERFADAWRLELEQEKRTFFGFINPGLYFPGVYLAPATMTFLARKLSLRPLTIFYLGRLANLFLATLLIFWAIRITPILKWTLFVLAFLPTSLSLRSSWSADAIINGLAILLAALIMRRSLEKRKLTPMQLAQLLFLFVFLGLSKQVYCVFVALLFLLPKECFLSQARRWGFFWSRAFRGCY